MKRFISLLLLVSVMFLFGFAYAEDLSKLDDEQLIALSVAVNSEIIQRNLNKKVKVPTGTYIVGQDIPAGDYTIRPTGTFLRVDIYEGEVKLGNRTGIFSANQEEIIGKISLKEGQIVEISFGGSTFEKYAGLGF